jgi:uncharacterized protein YndB with AHSA1/START domain
MIKKILGVVALVVVVFLAYVAMLPGSYRVERSVVVAAPAETVYGAVADLRRWGEWSPWEKLDPGMKKEFAGTPAAPGSTYHWAGNDKVGEGRMTLVEASPPSRLAYKLEFLKPWESVSTSDFTLAPEGAGTRVSWSMRGEIGFVEKIFGVFMDMNAMIGKDFEQGLASLKQVAEAGPR